MLLGTQSFYKTNFQRFSGPILTLVLLITLRTPIASAQVETSETLECIEAPAMGTPFKFCVTANSSEVLNAKMQLQKALAKVTAIESWMSDWKPESELSKINQNAGIHPVRVQKALFDVLRETLEIAKRSEGTLDPTFNIFFGLYNFKPGQEREPTDAEIEERLGLINYSWVELNEKKLEVFLKKPRMKLGLGAVGQSYGADAAVDLLKAAGFKGGYVDGSGDTVFWGHKPGGALWTTAIRDPRDKEKIILRIYGTDMAVTTCGDDEKYFMRGDRRVHHVIDPKTGRPGNLSRQVTAISKRGFLADAWDTAGFVLGPARAKVKFEENGLRGVFVSSAGVVTMTKGLTKKKTAWGEGYEVEWDPTK